PIRRGRPPQAGEVEPVAIRQREPAALPTMGEQELRRGDQATMAGEAAPFGAHGCERSAARLPGPEPPGALDHLHPVAVAPYEGACLGLRIEIECCCLHGWEHNRNIGSAQRPRARGEPARCATTIDWKSAPAPSPTTSPSSGSGSAFPRARPTSSLAS